MYRHKNGLCLRKIEVRDLEKIAKVKSYSWTTQHQSVLLNSINQDQFFEKISRSDKDYYLSVSTLNDMTVGWVNVLNIDWISGVADVGMMAGLGVRGTPETKKLPEVVTDFCFEFLNLRRLQAEVLDNNPAAIKFDLAVGYKVEGRRRQAVFKSGRYHDSILIALLREEWESSDRVKAYGGICNLDYKVRRPIDRLLVGK